MDHIKPIDLEKTKLPHAMRGYDRHVVDALLARTATEIESLLIEQKQMKVELERQRAELQGYKGMESSLKDALLVAQRAADETRANAHKEADIILASAKQSAVEEQNFLAGEVKSLMAQIEVLQKERDRFQRQFRILLEDHMRELNQVFESPRAVVLAESAPEPATAEA